MFKSKILRLVIITALMSLTLSACQSNGTKQNTGSKIGALIGLAIGVASSDDNKAVNGIIGLAIGATIGSKIGKSMDDKDKARRSKALEKNRTNQPTAWTNPDTRNQYRITPKKTYRSANNLPCREFETEAFVRGRRHVYTSKACRDSNGNWQEVTEKG